MTVFLRYCGRNESHPNIFICCHDLYFRERTLVLCLPLGQREDGGSLTDADSLPAEPPGKPDSTTQLYPMTQRASPQQGIRVPRAQRRRNWLYSANQKQVPCQLYAILTFVNVTAEVSLIYMQKSHLFPSVFSDLQFPFAQRCQNCSQVPNAFQKKEQLNRS